MTDLSNPYGTPFGLLDQVYGEGTAKAMREHGGPYEVFTGYTWEAADPSYFLRGVYRVKPAPREVVAWGVYSTTKNSIGIWDEEAEARDLAKRGGYKVVKLTGVIE